MSDRLLTIDVQAALHKISLGRLKGAHQIPVALARAAVRGGSEGLSVNLGRGRLEFVSRGSPVDARAFSSLASLLDLRQDDLHRQRALEDLESLGLLDLLVAFAMDARMVVLQGGAGVKMRLVARKNLVRLEQDGSGDFSLVLSGVSGPWSRWRDALAEHLRFAPFAVQVNRRRIDRDLHLTDVLGERRFVRDGIRGLVGLPRQGLAARTRIVVDGVLEEDIWDSPPSGAVWDAVVQCAAQQRARILALVDGEAARLVSSTSRRADDLRRPDRDRLTRILFRLADRGAGAGALGEAALFRMVSGQRVSCRQLRDLAMGRIIRAVSPAASLGRYEIDGPVFWLDELERGFIESHLGLVVREPRRKPSQRGLLTSQLAGWGRAVRRWARESLRRLIASGEIPSDALDPEEALFLQALSDAAERGLLTGARSLQPAFVRSRWLGWRWLPAIDGPGRLLLGRRHRRVRQMVQGFSADPAMLYPALMLLADGRDAFGEARPAAVRCLLGIDDPGDAD